MGVEFIYFDVQGRGTQFRLCMKIAGLDFTDTIIPCADWQSKKAEIENIGLGQLPILKVDGKIFCQSDAMYEWAAKKANLIPEDPEKALAMRMVVETLKECGLQAFMGAIGAVEASGGKFFSAEGMGGTPLPDDVKEKRNKVAVPAMIGAIIAQNTKIEKVLKMTQSNENYCVGDSMTYADIAVFGWKQFCEDPTFNKYGDIKSTLSPAMAKIAANLEKHPAVQKYLETDGKMPYTGMNILW